MRLLWEKNDGSFALTQNFVKEDEAPKYAILSHTWLAAIDEVTFDDIENGKAAQRTIGHGKIRFCSQQAARDDLQYFWVDTCCIDKSSSQELQEAITRMYQWYHNATRCYAYLTDVSVGEDEVDNSISPQPWHADFRKSRWFKRGWTLPELLAPASVEFYSVEGTRLGDKKSLQQCIHQATGIPYEALQGGSLGNFTVAKRMSWAEYRQTTRPEDKAYSLLGIFDVFMPLIYGEGEKHAFDRLQKEINEKHAESLNLEDLLHTLPTVPAAAFNSRENQYAPTCLPNTRVELLRDITDWVNGSDDRCIFWLNGIAGTGKSTIARTIAGIYYRKGILGGSFFFSKGGGDASHADKLFPSLASQLALQIPYAKRHICDAIKEHKDIAQSSLREQLDQLIISPLSKLDSDFGPSVIVLVLDAIDECDNERDIKNILRLLTMISRALKVIRLRIFVTSRPEIPIRVGWLQIPEAERHGFVLHDIAPALVDRDLTLFFTDNFTDIRRERSFSEDWPGERKISRLVEISCGLFIWASTACRYIREGRQAAKRRVDKLIHGQHSREGPEKQLDRIYLTVLKDSVPEGYEDDEKQDLYDRLRKVLGGIVVLLSPLSMDSLANLLHIEADLVSETLADLHTILNIPTTNDRPIRLHHPTFRDFLLDRNRCRDLDFWIDDKEAHKVLGEHCVQIMSEMLEADICGVHSPGTLIEDVEPSQIQRCIPPELQYACLYWAEHYRQSGTCLRDDDTTHRFFKKHFLHWLEAMSWIGKGSEMDAVIRMYRSLLVSADNSAQIPFLDDSRRLIFAFQSIIEHTPLQVYCAALAFIQPSNRLRAHFWDQIHTWLNDIRIARADAPEGKDEINYVNDLAYTPDGKEVASGSIDEWVRVWDVSTKAPLTRFGGQISKVSSVAISPDGKLLASGSDDTTVMVWDTGSKVVRYALTGHKRWVNTVVFSPDGKILASGSMDETVRLWDTANGKEFSTLEADSSCVNSVVFSPDSKEIASGTVDRLIRLWDLKKKEIRIILDGHRGPVNSVQFSPNGKRIVSGSDDMTIRLWDAISGAELRRLTGHVKKVRATTFSRDARRIASGSEDRTIKLWNADTGDLLSTLMGHASGINAIAYSPDGKLIASGSFNDEVRLWDAKTGETRGKLADFEGDTEPLPGEMSKNPFSDSNALSDESFKGHSSTVTSLVVSPDGQSIASGSHDTTIKLFMEQGTERCKLEGHSMGINHLAFSPDSQLLASASIDKTTKLWYPASGALSHTLEGHSDAVRLVRFSSDGCLLASCSADKTVRLWDTTTGAALSELVGHTDTVNDIAFAWDNNLIASCSADMTICIWDTRSGAMVFEQLRGHDDSINSIAFSSDNKLLVSGSSDKTIRIWKIASGSHITLQGHTMSVNSATFSRDMKWIASCSDDSTIRIWDLSNKTTSKILEVDVVLHAISFSNRDQYIVTDRGTLTISSSRMQSPSPSLQSVDTLFITEHWVRHGTENVLWLPHDYCAVCVATWDKTAVLGHSSGAISFIRF